MAGKRKRLTAEEEKLLIASAKLGNIFQAIRLLEVGARVWDTEREPDKILEAVFMGPAAVAQASARIYGWKGAARGTLTVTRPWMRKKVGRPREPWERDLAEYDALRSAGKSASSAAEEVREAATRQGRRDVSWDARTHIRNCQDRRRRARKHAAAK